MFMVHSSWHSHCKVRAINLMKVEQRQATAAYWLASAMHEHMGQFIRVQLNNAGEKQP